MPVETYDSLFGGPGSAAKVMAALVKQYGATKARQVFYGLVAERRKKAGGKGSRAGGFASQRGKRSKGKPKKKAKAKPSGLNMPRGGMADPNAGGGMSMY